MSRETGNRERLPDQTPGIFSWGMRKIPNLSSFFDEDVVFSLSRFNEKITAIAGWGVKAKSKRARRFAVRKNLPYISIEDGFLRSFGLGVKKTPPLSIVVDDVGIYYDATRPSLLENILNSDGWETDSLMEDAQKAMSLVVENSLSKYNHAPDAPESMFRNTDSKKVLVADQNRGFVNRSVKDI